MIWVINHLLHLGPAEAGKWVHIFKHDYDRWILKLISHILKYYSQYPCPKFVFFERTFCIKHPNFPPPKKKFSVLGCFPEIHCCRSEMFPHPAVPPQAAEAGLKDGDCVTGIVQEAQLAATSRAFAIHCHNPAVNVAGTPGEP